MGEKITIFLRFFELFINPQTAPIFILSSIKNLSQKEKEVIDRSYRELVNLELESVTLDMDYNEEREAKYILKTIKRWSDIKKDVRGIVDYIIQMQEKGVEKKKVKSYCG
jgi:hypothetical protein